MRLLGRTCWQHHQSSAFATSRSVGITSSVHVAHQSQLVSSGIITANEFWASRQHLIDAELSKDSAQQKGTPTALIAEVRPSQVRALSATQCRCDGCEL